MTHIPQDFSTIEHMIRALEPYEKHGRDAWFKCDVEVPNDAGEMQSVGGYLFGTELPHMLKELRDAAAALRVLRTHAAFWQNCGPTGRASGRGRSATDDEDVQSDHAPQDGFLTVQKFAEALVVSEGSVLAWIREGRLPAVRLGRLTFIPVDALTRVLDRSCASRS